MKWHIPILLVIIRAFSLNVAAQQPTLKAPAAWQENGWPIAIKDNLQCSGVSWPYSVISYDLDFGPTGVNRNALRVLDAKKGHSLPFQLTNIRKVNNMLRKASLLIATDLPSGADKSIRIVSDTTIKPGVANHEVSVIESRGNIILTNGLVKVLIPSPAATLAAAPVLKYGNTEQWLGYGIIPDLLKQMQMTVQELVTGPLLTEYKIIYTGGKAMRYEVKVKLEAGAEFITLEENMTGFGEKEVAAWRMIWDNIQPEQRYASTRNSIIDNKQPVTFDNIRWEPITGIDTSLYQPKHPLLKGDQENTPDGKLPFHLAAYDNWMSWWRLPSAAFWSEKNAVTIGAFIKETDKWNDGKYPVWGSKNNLSITFYWQHNRLSYHFPLINGSRSVALAAYPHEKDRELIAATKKPLAYIDYLRRWYGWVPLNKVKDWILDYPSSTERNSPAYFKPVNAGNALPVAGLEQSLRNMVLSVATGAERNIGPTPVGSRVFYETLVPSFDINKPKMTDEQFRRLRAWFLFMAYVYMDEALMPVRTMLAGHPNFLMDLKVVPALSAFLFPDHPQATAMAEHFEKAVQLNARYHIRPSVPVMNMKGGRWTENLATYTWAALRPTLRTNHLLYHHFDGKNRFVQPGTPALCNWLLNALTSPLDLANGKRTYPPQGAHAHDFREGPPEQLRQLAQTMVYYDPLLAEHLLAVTSAGDEPFEGDREKVKVWKDVLKGEWEHNTGTMPQLKSEKFTGYGYVLRSRFGQKDEMYVHLQQIDDGPNYRWGRAAAGGNGIIYYTAGGKRYSFNGPEDVGDGPFGDVERVTNFGVKKQGGYRALGAYRSVGRNDLRAPLYDFGFAQFAAVYANKEALPDYISRSVLQSGADYIVIIDDVANAKTQGRFSWFVGTEDSFPAIHQLAPGAAPVDAMIQPSKSSYHSDPAVLPARGRYYDGIGDFLTVVTHKKDLQVTATAWGCEVRFPDQSTDMVFRGDREITYENNGILFTGSSGIVKKSISGSYSAALFQGNRIAAGGLKIVLNGTAGVGFSTEKDGGYTGVFRSDMPQQLQFFCKNTRGLVFYLDGVALLAPVSKDGMMVINFPAGFHHWQWNRVGLTPATPEIKGVVTAAGSCRVIWNKVPGAVFYQVRYSSNNGNSWQSLPPVKDTFALLTQLQNDTKIHLCVSASAAGTSAASALYPAYINNRLPHYPEGLMLYRQGNQWQISWGKVLGASHYTLYRRKKGAADTSYQKIYSGDKCMYNEILSGSSVIWEYAVTATNGNGESIKSHSCNTDPDSFINWQPVPGEGFRRDTENHENGFPEFDPLTEDRMPVLTYPSFHSKTIGNHTNHH